MATQSLIIANTSPTVEVYRIADGANTYILAQDGYSTNAPNTVSIQIDYSNYYDRIATSLESISSTLVDIKSSIDNVYNSLNENNSYAQKVAQHFEVERAILVAVDLNEDDKPKVVTEINNPTLP